MTTSPASRQARLEERKRQQGLTATRLWLSDKTRKRLRELQREYAIDHDTLITRLLDKDLP